MVLGPNGAELETFDPTTGFFWGISLWTKGEAGWRQEAAEPFNSRLARLIGYVPQASIPLSPPVTSRLVK